MILRSRSSASEYFRIPGRHNVDGSGWILRSLRRARVRLLEKIASHQSLLGRGAARSAHMARMTTTAERRDQSTVAMKDLER